MKTIDTNSPVYVYASTKKNLEVLKRDCDTVINNYLKHKPQMWFTPEDRYEVFGDFCQNLILRWQSYNPAKKASVRTWSWTVARTSLIDYLRKHHDFLPLFIENEDGDEVEIEQLASKHTVEDEVIANQTCEFFDSFVEGQTDIDSELMVLSTSGYSVKELAEMYSLPAEKVSSKLFKMRQSFKKDYALAA